MRFIGRFNSFFLGAVFAVVGPGANAHAAESLESIARASLESNIVSLPAGSVLTAGATVYRTAWTRDFSFSARGLYQIGRDDVIRSHLDRLIRETESSTGLVPRVMDSIQPRYRVILNTLSRHFSWLQKSIPDLHEPLRAEYQDEHGSRAIDSNLLALITAEEWSRRGSAPEAERKEWFRKNSATFRKWYHYYDSLRDSADGLIQQPPFSDWQDSTNRSGKTFFSNLLLLKVMTVLHTDAEWGISEAQVREFENHIRSRFFDSATGLYRSLEQGPQISLDGNLLLLDWSLLEGSNADLALAFYQRLKQHPLVRMQELPGFATYPAYPNQMKSWAVRIAGLDGYHDHLHWTWLMGLYLKIASRMGDQSERQKMIDALESFARRDGTIREIYDSKKGYLPFQKALFSSEKNFSWGAAMILDGMNESVH